MGQKLPSAWEELTGRLKSDSSLCGIFYRDWPAQERSVGWHWGEAIPYHVDCPAGQVRLFSFQPLCEHQAVAVEIEDVEFDLTIGLRAG
jgi:hypothetical protein